MPVDVHGVPDNRVRMRELSLQRQVMSEPTELTMTGTLFLQDGISTTYQYLNPNGSDRDVRMPPPRKGLMFFCMHVGSANTITYKDVNGTTLTKIDASNATTTTGQFLTFHCTAITNAVGTWRVI